MIYLVERSAADEGNTAVKANGQAIQQPPERGVGHHLLGTVGQVQQCSIQIEEQARTLEQFSWRVG